MKYIVKLILQFEFSLFTVYWISVLKIRLLKCFLWIFCKAVNKTVKSKIFWGLKFHSNLLFLDFYKHRKQMVEEKEASFWFQNGSLQNWDSDFQHFYFELFWVIFHGHASFMRQSQILFYSMINHLSLIILIIFKGYLTCRMWICFMVKILGTIGHGSLGCPTVKGKGARKVCRYPWSKRNNKSQCICKNLKSFVIKWHTQLGNWCKLVLYSINTWW